MINRSLETIEVTVEAWEQRWLIATNRLRDVEEENTRLRAALDELNADIEELLSDAAQVGNEAAKSHAIRTQMASIRRLKARLRELEEELAPGHARKAFDELLGNPIEAVQRLSVRPRLREEKP